MTLNVNEVVFFSKSTEGELSCAHVGTRWCVVAI